MDRVIETNRLVFRMVTAADAGVVHQLHSLKEVDRYNTLGIPGSMEQTRQLVESWVLNQSAVPLEKYVFSIETHSGVFVGLFGLNIGKATHRNAEIWYKLHPAFWSKGFATEAVAGMLNFCFNDLALHRVTAGCAIGNIASIRVLEKTGFKREAYHRKILPIRSEWVDNYEYAILEEDFGLM